MNTNEVNLMDNNIVTYKQELNTKSVNEINISDITGVVVFKKKYKVLKYINLFVKKMMDIIGGILGVILLIPLAIILQIINWCNKDFGPLFYKHERIGKNGKHFNMYKFRTMCTDSEEVLEKLLKENEQARNEWEEYRKLGDDPRITKVGKFLRKTSIDEFPQFINVLLGDMSLVGPRAVVDDEIEKFGVLKDKVLSVKPGITGNWAANGRSTTDYDQRVYLEAEYIDKFSIFFDIKILFKTIISVLKREGAV